MEGLQTPGTLDETFANSAKLQGSIVLALVGMRLYPNTPLFDRALRESVISAETDFLQPRYYISPQIDEESAFQRLRAFSERSPNWIVGAPSPAYMRMADRLRSRGVVGPLWSYFATMQRLALGLPQNQSTNQRSSG